MNKSTPSPSRRPSRPSKASGQSERAWVVAAAQPGAAKLGAALELPVELASLLIERGCDSVDSARRFLEPSLRDLHDPYLMHGMTAACARIRAGVAAGERICVFGDYDVDGITSTVILVDALRTLGAEVTYYIPHRVDEGYGLNPDAIRSIAEDGVKLVISVDCGVTAHDETALAKELGVDVVVTDHHRPGETLPPDAVAVVHPAIADAAAIAGPAADSPADVAAGQPAYPFAELAGVGVALKLAQALLDEETDAEGAGLGRSSTAVRSLRFLDLVCMGTMADSVPLLGENRILVAEGLKVLQRTTRPGMRALLGVAGLREKKLSARDITFGLAPRLNAAGRLDTAQTCVELLLSTDRKESEDIAGGLDKLNRSRQEVEEGIRKRAEEMIAAECDPEKDHIIFLAAPGWHTGVQGIVASKMLDRYRRPTFMLSIEDGIAKGSARSFGSFHLHQALTRCQDLLERFGGHAYAAGLAVKEEHLPELKARLSVIAEEMMTEEDLNGLLHIDAEADIAAADRRFFETVRALAPFGVRNPAPSFLLRGHPVEVKRIGKKQDHLRFVLSGKGSFLEAVAFHRPLDPVDGEELELVAHLEIDEWNGNERLQLNVVDMRKGEARRAEVAPADLDIEGGAENGVSDDVAAVCDLPESVVPEYLLEASSQGFPAVLGLTGHRDLLLLSEHLSSQASPTSQTPNGAPSRVALWLTADDLAARMFAEWLGGSASGYAGRTVLFSRTRTRGEEDADLAAAIGSGEPAIVIGGPHAFGLKGADIQRLTEVLSRSAGADGGNRDGGGNKGGGSQGATAPVITVDWPDDAASRLGDAICAATGARVVRTRFVLAEGTERAYKVVDRREQDIRALLKEIAARDPGLAVYTGVTAVAGPNGGSSNGHRSKTTPHPFTTASGQLVLAAPPLSAWAMKQFCIAAWGNRTMLYLAYSRKQMDEAAAFMDATAPSRDVAAKVYTALRAAADGATLLRLADDTGLPLLTVRAAVRYMEEVGIVRTSVDAGGEVTAFAEPNPRRVSLDDAPSKSAAEAESTAFGKIRSFFLEGKPYAFERFLES